MKKFLWMLNGAALTIGVFMTSVVISLAIDENYRETAFAYLRGDWSRQ